MQGLTQIREGILCLQAVSTASVSDDELTEAMVEFHRLESMLAAQQARFVEELDTRKLWRADGSKACWAWLSRRCTAAPATTKSVVGLGKRLRLAPKTKAAFEAGEIDRDRAVELSRRAASCRKQVADTFPDAEEDLLEHAKSLPFDSFGRALRYWESLVDEDGEEEQAEDDFLSRNLHASEFLRGMVRVDGTLDPIGGAIFARELSRIEREMFHTDWDHAKAQHGQGTRPEHLTRTPAQRRADALVEMARRSAGFSGRSDSDGLPQPLLVVHCGEGAVARMCELASVRHGALSTGRGERTRLRPVVAGCMKLEAARPWRRRVGWQAASTMPGRTGTARRSGPGERDGEVYDIETSYGTPLRFASAQIWWIGAGQRCTPSVAGATPKVGWKRRPGGHGESLRRSRGEAAGEQLGAYPVERLMVNVGTAIESPTCRSARPNSGNTRRLWTARWWGGALVVVRARESRVHGEGGQRTCSLGAATTGDRR